MLGSLDSNFFLAMELRRIETFGVFYGASTTSALMTRANRTAA
jgi:hypothetical protein